MTNPTASEYWDPPWLRKSALFAFMATFILLAVGLVLIWSFVNQYDGIPLTLTTNHYAWTYGPTAVLTVVVSLWRRVNYCIMVNQPWQGLHKGPQEASKTVLLDYIWPLQITSFVLALKNRHLAVATSIMIFSLLKLVMVISTALFVLGNASLSQDIHVRLLKRFGDAGYGVNDNSVGGDSVWDYFNLREQYHDTAAPVELSTAYTDYSIMPKIPEGAGEVSTLIDVLKANVTCEVATVSWSLNQPGASFNLSLTSPTCGPLILERYFWAGVRDCNNHSFEAQFISPPAIPSDRFIFVAVEGELALTSPSISLPDGFQTWELYNVTIRRTAAVTCDLDYSIHQGVARGPAFDTRTIDSLQIGGRVRSQIENITNSTLLNLAQNSLSSVIDLVVHDDSVPQIDFFQKTLVGLLTDSRNITRNAFDLLLNVSLLQNRAEDTLAGLSHQLIRRYFLASDNNTATSGSIDYTENRLYTRSIALWTMVGLLSVITCLMVVVLAQTTQRLAPQSPESIATAAYTISRSPDMATLLGDSSATRLGDIRTDLTNYDFATIQDRAGAFHIKTFAVTREGILPKSPSWLSRKWKLISSDRTKDSVDSKSNHKKAWMPYSSRTHAISLTIFLPIIAIAALEVLWSVSENDQSFVTVSSDSSLTAYVISALATGDATVERTMLFTIAVGYPPPSTVGSLLTIVSSGLWFGTAIEISRDVTVDVKSDWDVDFTAYKTPNLDTLHLINDLEHGVPDEATLIWGNVVLPKIGNPQPPTSSELRETFKGDTLHYNLAVPAIRPVLECSAIPPSNFTIEVLLATNETYYTTVNTGILLPVGYVALQFGTLDTQGPASPNWWRDSFFSHVVFGPDGHSRESLLGSGNVDTLIAAVNEVYQRFMVHVIDREWRASRGVGNTAPPTPNGGIARGSMTVTVTRLKLNKTSKIILQVFLGTMVLFGGIAWRCVDMRVLPRNPYPIASGMALFAGSRLIRESTQGPGGSRQQGQQMVIKRKPLMILKGKRFRLGWWEDSRASADNDCESHSTSQVLSSTVSKRFGIDVDDNEKGV
ncbi:hypothetical protein EKO27_g1755 [Xylaria grammica]|uniref:Uncharacterized protein n=1 Tax=Xylaria grammica TaxID=363999 RepID=A0A439DG06_9PEZI|nr:hypothetical protein EKO27_g1755 [Xylaria grammica]